MFLALFIEWNSLRNIEIFYKKDDNLFAIFEKEVQFSQQPLNWFNDFFVAFYEAKDTLIQVEKSKTNPIKSRNRSIW